MQRKNLLQFVIAAALFISGMLFLQNRLFPPPPKTPELDADTSLPAAEKNRRAAGALGSFGAALALDKKGAAEKERAAQAEEKNLPAAEKTRRSAGVLGSFGGPLAMEKKGAEKARATPPPRLVTLGSADPDSDFHLEVQFTSRGGSVRRIILNKFKKASSKGLPVNESLELVSPPPPWVDPNLALNANVLYHYDVDRPKDEHPRDTLGTVDWDVTPIQTSGDRQSVSFSRTIQGVQITKTFSLAPQEYHLGLEVKLKRAPGATAKELKFRYQLTGGLRLPIEGGWYTPVFRESLIGLLENDNLWRNHQDLREIAGKQGGESVTRDQAKHIQYAGIKVQYFASVIVVDNDQPKRDYLTSARPTLEARVAKIELEEELKPGENRLIVRDKKDKSRAAETYYLSPAVVPIVRSMRKGAHFGLLCYPRPDGHLEGVKLLTEAETQPLFLDDVTVRVNTEPTELVGDQEVVHKYLLYNGPTKPMLLGQMKGIEAVDPELVDRYVKTLHLNTLTDYQSSGWIGSFSSSIYWTYLLIFFTNLMHNVLWFIHMVIPNYGICIILLTVLVRGIMFPISRKQALTSMKMQQLAPEMKKMQEKFKDDPRAKTEAMMALYRKHGVNPLGSCWLLLLQMPIFMGLYYALQESVHFRLAGFAWIENLAAPDMLIAWGEKIPWISRPEDYGSLLYLGPYFNLLPVLAVTLMIAQQKLLMPPPTDEQQAMQMKMMKYMMIFMGLLFYKMPAGLCLYFIASSLWGFAERKLLPKKKPASDGVSADSLFQKMTTPAARDLSPTAPREAITTPETRRPVTNGDGDPVLGNRARRRLERKRRQERGQIQSAPAATARAEESIRRPPGDGEATGKGLRGWWAGVRRKVGAWWQDVLKQASKK